MAFHLRRVLTLTLAAAICGVAAAAAAAGSGPSPTTGLLGSSSCGATSTPFAPWGDGNSYVLTSDGDLSAAADGWTLTGGANALPGTGPLVVASPEGPQTESGTGITLLIPAGATAISPATCFGLLTPGIRFFAKSDSGTATIHVRIIATGLLGVLSILDGGTASVGTSWAPTPVFSTTLSQLDTVVGAKSIKIEITSSGPVQIDDVYLDPFCSH